MTKFPKPCRSMKYWLNLAKLWLFVENIGFTKQNNSFLYKTTTNLGLVTSSKLDETLGTHGFIGFIVVFVFCCFCCCFVRRTMVLLRNTYNFNKHGMALLGQIHLFNTKTNCFVQSNQYFHGYPWFGKLDKSLVRPSKHTVFLFFFNSCSASVLLFSTLPVVLLSKTNMCNQKQWLCLGKQTSVLTKGNWFA